MTTDDYNNYDEKTKSQIFEEMCKLYTIISDYPTTTEDLKTFAKWQWGIAKFGKDLEGFLYGIYPSAILDNLTKESNKEEFDRIVKLSDDALRMTKFWNRIVYKTIEKLIK